MNIFKVVLLALCFLNFSTINSENNIIIDSKMTLKEALKGSKATMEILDKQVLLDVEYYGFDNKIHKGQIVVSQDVKQDVIEAFAMIKETKFPIKKVVPITFYDWSDDQSMADNNTSAFNYRPIANTDRLSNHSFGKAIDFNPVQNPAVYNDGKISPKGAKYDQTAPGTLSNDSELTKFFKSRGWRWGGDWTTLKDYQHFDKVE